jgi:hypothetical protein
MNQMTPHSVLNTLRVLANSELHVGGSAREHLPLMEKIVADNYAKFISLDIATIISSFCKLGYIPRSVLEELNQMPIFSIFNKHSALLVFEGLT